MVQGAEEGCRAGGYGEILVVIGVVGSEAAKFTEVTEAKARIAIRELLPLADLVVSGACHLGGIDLWAVEEAILASVPTHEFPPARLTWNGGYRERNLEIVQASDFVVCITVKKLPPNYTGMRFQYCYHCHTSDHVKSGGCWTVKQALQMDKLGDIVVIGE